MRVVIIGDHCWAGFAGELVPVPAGGYEAIELLGKVMVKVKLDSGDSCYAEYSKLQGVKE